jgi:hypothetical protein
MTHFEYSREAEYDPPDGYCVDCGEPTEAEHHWRCPSCYRELQGWAPRSEQFDRRIELAEFGREARA